MISMKNSSFQINLKSGIALGLSLVLFSYIFKNWDFIKDIIFELLN